MKSFFKILFKISLLLLTCLSISSLLVYYYYYNNTPDIDLSVLNVHSNSQIKTEDGKTVAYIGDELIKFTSFDDIPKVMIDALLAIEDQTFFHHKGVSYRGIIRAGYQNITKGSYAQGASTITQQLVKNIYLTKDKTMKRKINEVFLAMKLEKLLPKQKILEAYLNNILFGGRVYGIGMASLYYFSKEVKDLNLPEAALLAGLIQLPNRYNPFTNPEAALKRRNIVLAIMLEIKMITEQEYQLAINTSISTSLNKGVSTNIYHNYLDYLYDYLGSNNIDFYHNDLQMTIAMDQKMQDHINRIMTNETNLFPDAKMQCGIVVIENKSGKIRAIGNTREKVSGNLNYATSVLHQPASAIKPILDYAPAIEFLNYTPGMIVFDEPTTYNTGEPIHNWDQKHRGPISIRVALRDSRNIPALNMLREVGIERAIAFANRFELNIQTPYNEAMAIGGFTNGLSVLSLTQAYTAFPNMGLLVSASPLVNISGDQNINHAPAKSVVMKESTAFLMNTILRDVIRNTTYDINRYSCGKTGQSNLSSDIKSKYKLPKNAYKDAWMISYTKDLTVGVWVGYPEISSSYYLKSENREIPKTIARDILHQFSQSDKSPYLMPDGLEIVEYAELAGNLYIPSLVEENQRKTDYFFRGYHLLESLIPDIQT